MLQCHKPQTIAISWSKVRFSFESHCRFFLAKNQNRNAEMIRIGKNERACCCGE